MPDSKFFITGIAVIFFFVMFVLSTDLKLNSSCLGGNQGNEVTGLFTMSMIGLIITSFYGLKLYYENKKSIVGQVAGKNEVKSFLN